MSGSPFVFAKTDQDFIRRLVDAGVEIHSVYDIGASNGLWSHQIAEIVPEATFELFEPHESEQYAEILARNLKARPDFRMHRVALGDKDATLSLHLPSEHAGGTLLGSDWKGFVERKSIPVRRLDNLIADLGLRYPDVIKMDTQGFELKILQGAERACRHVKAILLEAWLYRLYGPRTPLLGELIEWLEPRGFVLVDLGCGWRSPGAKLQAVDGFFVRTEIANRLKFDDWVAPQT